MTTYSWIKYVLRTLITCVLHVTALFAIIPQIIPRNREIEFCRCKVNNFGGMDALGEGRR